MVLDTLKNLWEQTGFMNLEWGNYVMVLVALVFLYLAIAKGFEPLLLVPIAFGMLLVNLFPDIMKEIKGGEAGGLLRYFYLLDEWSILPSLIFLADSKKEYICTKEARKLGIPTIGLIDSNCNPDDVDYVIPGNDDAVRSVSLIAGKIADAVVEAKEGNLTEAPVDEEVETMDELVKKEGVDKIERKPRQNNRRNNYQRKDRVSKENKVEEKSEENK